MKEINFKVDKYQIQKALTSQLIFYDDDTKDEQTIEFIKFINDVFHEVLADMDDLMIDVTQEGETRFYAEKIRREIKETIDNFENWLIDIKITLRSFEDENK